MSESTANTVDPLADAVAFFAAHGALGIRPGESEEQARERGGRELAVAEAWAKRTGCRFTWREDDLGRSHADVYGPGSAYEDEDGTTFEPSTCEVCLLNGPDGEVLASLGCIDDADANYRRVVEAELASEALDAFARGNDLHEVIPADYPVQPVPTGTPGPGISRCGTCDLSWDDAAVTSITPVPSARCPFEAFHIGDDGPCMHMNLTGDHCDQCGEYSPPNPDRVAGGEWVCRTPDYLPGLTCGQVTGARYDGRECEECGAPAPLQWESAGTDEPGDQNADSLIVAAGCTSAYWSLGAPGPRSDGRWSVELIGVNQGDPVQSAGVDLGRFDSEALAKAAAEDYERRTR